MKAHRNLIYIALHIYFVLIILIKSVLVPSIAALAVSVFQGCSKQACSQDGDFTEKPQRISVKSAVHYFSDAPVKCIDALVYNDDVMQRIDCYQRFDKTENETLLIGSCSGPKIIFLCANSQWTKDDWRESDSFNKLKRVKAELERESRQHPLMTAETYAEAGDILTDIRFTRLSSTIELRSISCDFSGKPYDGERITEAKAYLININGSCSIIPQDSYDIERIINHGELISEDLKSFRDSSLIINYLGTIGPETLYPKTELICYPNTCDWEGAESQYTRLVIEGKISGETWYWPIDINRGSGNPHEGIERNMKYTYDITIHRKGTKDPNHPILQETAEVDFTAEKWTEQENYHIAF